MSIAGEAALDHLDVPADLRLLGDVRAWVRRRAEPGAFSDRDLGDIELAVTEAVSNVIRHAYAGDRKKRVSIRAGLSDERFVISIRDNGPPFSGIPANQDREFPRESGYGLDLISSVMDAATWARLPDGCNELRLIRVCPGARRE